MKIKAKFKPPREEYMGNLLWANDQAKPSQTEVVTSLQKIRQLGYWASPYPEGDGIAFRCGQGSKKDVEILSDFRLCFEWLDIVLDLTFSKKIASNNLKIQGISDEESKEISKLELARVQLEDAIDLFLSGKRISAITLAGAADGIFSGMLKQRGELSASEETWESIENIRKTTGLKYAGDRNIKEARKEWNQHQESPHFSFPYRCSDQAGNRQLLSLVGFIWFSQPVL